ncbi:MAG: hypothetical protein ACI8TQ_002990 [Planctomycetota bacterium]|jgi:hypothetical protein
MPSHIHVGVCRALYVFDIGRSIDLALAESSLTEVRRTTFQHKSQVPTGEGPPPLRFALAAPEMTVGSYKTQSEVEVVLYGQGVIGLTWILQFETTLDVLADLSAQLYARADFVENSRGLADQVAASIEAAIDRPSSTGLVEDYVIFQVQPVEDPQAFHRTMRAELAQLLRAESSELAEQEINDATSHPVSYEVSDLCLVDWLAAFLMGTDTEDERLVLEFAIVELMLLRVLDTNLDQGIEQAYELLSRPRNILKSLMGQGRELEQIARMQADEALLHEGIDNALKLFGDDYLARLHRTSAKRFHFEDWDRSIQRKLGVLQSIYSSLSDVAAHGRAEGLEWIIIILIAIDIAIYLI